MLRGNLPRLRREVRAQAGQESTSEWQIWKSYVLRPLIRRDIFQRPFLAQRRYREYEAIFQRTDNSPILLRPEVVRESGLLQEYADVRPRLGQAWRSPVRVNQIDALTGQDTHAHLATSWRCATLFGIESRFPYLDRRVVEFCVGVPPEQHRRDNWGRLILRRSADRRIPAQIARRRDKSSTWPDVVRGVAQNEAALLDRFRRWAQNPQIASFLDIPQMRNELQKMVNVANGIHGGARPVIGIFCRAMAVGQWLENSAGRTGG
jgi:asparagine synthase